MCDHGRSGHVSLARVTIDPYSSEPRYLQLAAILREQVECGELAPGDRLPSQATLMQRYGVARVTAGKTLQTLVEEGLAVTVPGMGTYVRPANYGA
jgi:GntR family transcriptional regulator